MVLQVLASVSANGVAPGLDLTLTGIVPDAASGKVDLRPWQNPAFAMELGGTIPVIAKHDKGRASSKP